MRVWRLVRSKRAASAYDGEGARAEPGRWNSAGVRMVYTSESVALAALEMLAKTRLVEGLRGRVAIPATIPDDAVVDAPLMSLPNDWRQIPHPASTKAFGDAWIQRADSLALKVPSVVAPGSNVLINPAHRRFGEVVIGPALANVFDKRLTGEES
jgi:RES domain-containing protein